MVAFGPARQFFQNDVLLLDQTAPYPDRAYRVVGSPELVIVIYNDHTATTGPSTLLVGNEVINLVSYPGFVQKAPKLKLRPWLDIERPYLQAPRKLSAERARNGHQQMCRLPNYRGTRTR